MYVFALFLSLSSFAVFLSLISAHKADKVDDDEAEVQLRPAKDRLKPVFRPLTVVSSPPVRAPHQGEVAQLTSQFHRLSQAVVGGDTFEGKKRSCFGLMNTCMWC